MSKNFLEETAHFHHPYVPFFWQILNGTLLAVIIEVPEAYSKLLLFKEQLLHSLRQLSNKNHQKLIFMHVVIKRLRKKNLISLNSTGKILLDSVKTELINFQCPLWFCFYSINNLVCFNPPQCKVSGIIQKYVASHNFSLGLMNRKLNIVNY